MTIGWGLGAVRTSLGPHGILEAAAPTPAPSIAAAFAGHRWSVYVSGTSRRGIVALMETMVTSTENEPAEDPVGQVADSDVASTPEEASPSDSVVESTEPVAVKGRSRKVKPGEGLPIKMLHDRILVQMEGPDGDRRSSGGILIPATAQVGKRLTWAEIVAAGPSVRTMELGDRVLFNPEDRYEVEVGGRDYIILRERDIHAVAAERLDDSPMGLYL